MLKLRRTNRELDNQKNQEMDKIFTYCVLKYRASYLLDERVNIGLLFHFIDDNKIVFIYPKSLAKISNLNPTVELKSIKNYLRGFSAKAVTLSNKKLQANKTRDIRQEFLLEDGNSFFFSEFKKGIYTSEEKIVAYYKELYFKGYLEKVYDNTTKSQVLSLNEPIVSYGPKKHTDAFLVKRFKDLLLKNVKNQQTLELFKIKVKHEHELGETVFDYAWQNGKTNLVKSISFDVKEKKEIQSKSFRWYGELSRLREKSLTDDYKFDLLLSPPSKKELLSSYREALRLLEDIEGPKSIIEEKDIEKYVKKAVSAALPIKRNVF